MYYKTIENKKEKWIVLLHCICSNMHIFDEYINKLSQEYNILLIDLPGHGKSNNYNDKIDFREVALKITEILEELKIEKFSVWGISLGGVIAKYLLEIVPQGIEKVIFEGPAFGIENKFYNFLFKLFNKVKGIFPKKLYLSIFVFAVIPGKKRKNIRKNMYGQLKEANYKKLSIWLEKLCEEFESKDFTLLNNVNVEKKYILGEEDYIFKNSTIKNIDINKYNKVIINEKTGHLCHLECEISL